MSCRSLLIILLAIALTSSTLTFAVEPLDIETTPAATDALKLPTAPVDPAPAQNPADGKESAAASAPDEDTELLAGIEDRAEEPPPFDYAPYRVLIWIASDDPQINAESLQVNLMKFLDRDFRSVWRTVVADAPAGVASIARRDLASITFNSISASDPVIALKRDHPDALRVHFASDAGRFLNQIQGTQARVQDIVHRIEQDPESKATPAKFEWINKLRPITGDAVDLLKLWKDPSTEAILVSRGMGDALTEPDAKLIVPPLKGQVIQAIEQFDKIFIVRLQTKIAPATVDVVELDTLMQYFGDVVHHEMVSVNDVAMSVGIAVRDAFSPVVRIDDAGKTNAKGLVRAAGLALDPDSPIHLRVGEVLVPLVRKDDRNGRPLTLGPLDFAYLYVTKELEHGVDMDFYSGRMTTLQGRKNNRTHRMAIRLKPRRDSTMLRLHAKGQVDEPLIGYELYGKELDSTEMTFVGRTDWNGKLQIDKIDRPLRLLYVKNGGAVLARLPIIPGHHEMVVADIAGDDMRLQAEAYIRGVQNAIVDLVAIRELFKARINMRMKEGKIKEADELLETLRNEPSSEKIANDMGVKQTMFLKAIGRNPNQQRKVDEMFSETRELLSKQINPRIINELELAMIEAKKGGAPPAAAETSNAEAPPATAPPSAAEAAPATEPPPAAAPVAAPADVPAE